VLVADLAQLLVLGLLLDLLLFEGIEVLGLVRMVVIVAVLVGVLKSHGWLVLFALQASLFMREPSRPEMVLGIVPWLYGLTSICLIAYAYLGRPFRNSVSKWLVTEILLAIGIEERTDSESARSRGSVSNWIRFVAIQFLAWMVIVLVAMLALLRLPISATARSNWLRNAMENENTVWPGATLLVLSLLLVIVFMEAGWRQMTGAQASLYLRSSFVLDHYRDLRMIVVRRLKSNAKLVSGSGTRKQLVERVSDVPPKL
jgi:hypothetical protein